MRPKSRLLTAALAALALADGAALAAEQRTSASLWGSGLEGTLQVGPGAVDFDVSVQELLAVLEGSITLRHEARGEARGWYAELVYNDLKKLTDGPLGERTARMQQTIVELGLSQPIAEDWELYGGARWETVDNSIEFVALPAATASTDWADAVLGVRWHTESEGGRWWARSDIAGGGSDGAFLIELGGARRFAEVWEFSFAYRLLDTRFEEGQLFLDLQQSGAILGVARYW
jgi:hypothetical protein